MEHVLTRKMARKVRQQLQQLQWAETHVERLGRATRRDLRMSIWDLQNRFYRQLDDTKKKRSQIETIRDQADKALQFWNAVLGQTSGLESTVETIDVEDQAAVSAIGQG